MQTGKVKAWMQRLKKLNTAIPFCKVCGKPIEDDSFRSFVFGGRFLCLRCFNLIQRYEIRWVTQGVRCTALYEYEGQIPTWLYQFKACGDIELGGAFFEMQAPYLRLKYHDYAIVPVPSSKQRIAERGFNQVEVMCEILKLPLIRCIDKEGNEKQSSLGKSGRFKAAKSLYWVKGFSVRNKKILLVDDVYTTGATVGECIRLLKMHQPRKLEVLIMSKTKEK